MNQSTRFKSAALESVSLWSWAYNLTWFYVDLTIAANGSSLDISSYIVGVSIYSYEQMSSPNSFITGNTSCTFTINGKVSVSLTQWLLNISLPCTGTGSADFVTGTGTLSFNG